MVIYDSFSLEDLLEPEMLFLYAWKIYVAK